MLGSKSYLTFDEGVERELTIHFRPGVQDRTAVPIASPAEEKIEPLADCGRSGRGTHRSAALAAARGGFASTPNPSRVGRDFGNSAFASKITPRSFRANEARRCERRSSRRTRCFTRAAGGFSPRSIRPPTPVRPASRLVNRHTWPVLVGSAESDAQRSALVLSSPIILYDFPAVAPQSEADTFDATEVDELMMLSVRSLSDDERDEARATDARARAIIERAERFGPEELARLHGTLLQTKPDAPGTADPFAALDVPGMDCVFVNGTKVSKGSRVRLHPKRRADVWDLFLDGKIATVRAVHQDVENLMYVAVTVDDDPASDLHDWYGRSLFFYPDEVEPVGAMAAG